MLDFNYSLIEKYENENSACLIYNFTKTGIQTTLAQTLRIDGGKIKEIILIFDSKSFFGKAC